MNTTVYNKKNNLLIPIIIILLIPMVFAIYFTMNPGEKDNVPLNITGVNVEYSRLGLNESFNGSDDIDLYRTSVLQAQKITSEFRDVSSEIPFTVTFDSENGEPMVYEFFMKFDRDECIYRTAQDEYFLFRPEDALLLLDRAEFQSINQTATAPYAIAGINGVTLAPTSGEWNHLNADGEFVVEKLDGIAANTTPVRINVSNLGTLNFGAKTVPDSVNVKLSLGSAVKHDGAYENMLNANVMSANDTCYDMVITAVWEENEDVDYHGMLTYSGQLFYDVSPTYKPVYNGSIIRGDFGIIKIENFNDGEKLFVESDFALPSELQVFRSPLGYSFAFIPVEYWTEGAVGTYDVKLSLADGSAQTVKMKIKDSERVAPASEKQEMLVPDLELSKHFTEEGFTEFYNLVAEKTAATETTQLWDGKFVYPNADNKKDRGTGMGDYGTLRTVNAGGLYVNSYYHNGIDFAMDEGESVLASNNGRVVFAGELTLTGNTVIIDHGCSILSYYGHLGTIGVQVGDTVSKSGVIGTAGKTGFAVAVNGTTGSATSQVHFAISMEGKFVIPYYLWNGGVDFDD